MKTEPDPRPGEDQPTRGDALNSNDLTSPAVSGLTILAVLATVAGVALRFWPRSGLWLDEALSVNIAALPFSDMVEALRHDGHPPLYYLMLHYWMGLFGDSDWAVRALSGVFSTASIPLAYVAGRRLATRRPSARLGSHRVGLITAAVVATMPYAIRYGAETRMYSLVMLLVLTGYLLADELLTPPSRVSDHVVSDESGSNTTRRSALLVIGTALNSAALLYSHYWAMWLLGAVGILALSTMWVRRNDSDRGASWRGPIRLIIGLVLGGLLYLPWLPVMAYQASHTGTPWGDKFGPVSVVVITLVDFAGGRFGVAQFFSYFLVMAAVGAAVVSIRSAVSADEQELVVEGHFHPRIRPELTVVALTMALGWAAAAASGNTFSSRYAAVVFPLVVMVVAAGLAVIRSPRATLVLVTAICAMGLLGSVQSARGDRSQNGELTDAIASDWSAHKGPAVVIACPDQLGVSLQRELTRRVDLARATGPVIPFPTAGDPDFVDWVDYAERNQAADPAKFLELISNKLTSETTIYLVSSGQYRTMEGKCEQLAADLAVTHPSDVLVDMSTIGLDEAASLRVFRPAE
ncbi:MAG: glycosyltransferase family 39 protein [Microthrixaceae bacterium]|nr:glycosyltransferase family 39 protein [Microthrixaceae bacterium]